MLSELQQKLKQKDAKIEELLLEIERMKNSQVPDNDMEFEMVHLEIHGKDNEKKPNQQMERIKSMSSEEDEDNMEIHDDEQQNETTEIIYTEAFDHTIFNDLLKKHVSSDGNVNYNGFKIDSKALQSYIDLLKSYQPIVLT